MRTKVGIEKPLAEVTLKEFKEICASHGEDCKKDGVPCPFYNTVCAESCVIAKEWDLTEKTATPKFTEQEVQDAKSIMRIFDADNIVAGRDNMGNMTILVYRSYAGGKGCFINKDLFPSIGVGETFHLSEIIGDADA